ncbi:MAG: hypothetical protein EBT39_05670, partial [Sphingobacteriia bacterium]|nr:hypothetical protein [Candidatus Fonsibacter lacus]
MRESIFGMVQFTPIEVKEIVGSLTRDIPIKDGEIKFQKIQDNNSGLAFGYIPTSDKEIVWFLQFASKIEESMTTTSKNLKLFCNELLKDFPEDIKNIINANDFSTTYVWNTHDFDLLPTFSHKNIVLIGDAAHLTLPFTSTGVTNAILDANALYKALMQFEDYNKVYEEYYRVRSENIKINIEQGRVLKKLFLNPDEIIHRNIPIPLSSSITENNIKPIQKKLKILYFTDPVCSSCWVIEPILRKLKMEYGDYLEIEYRMGGLLPSWKNYERGNIKIPSDAAKHWHEVSKLHDVPIDGDIWFEDPLSSSFPPSIAFKAAQLQSEYKALKFLRIIKEMVFIDKKNITKWDLIEEAALNAGLDSVVLLNDISGDAVNF